LGGGRKREERQAMGRGARRPVATVAAVERSRAMMYSGERERERERESARAM